MSDVNKRKSQRQLKELAALLKHQVVLHEYSPTDAQTQVGGEPNHTAPDICVILKKLGF